MKKFWIRLAKVLILAACVIPVYVWNQNRNKPEFVKEIVTETAYSEASEFKIDGKTISVSAIEAPVSHITFKDIRTTTNHDGMRFMCVYDVTAADSRVSEGLYTLFVRRDDADIEGLTGSNSVIEENGWKGFSEWDKKECKFMFTLSNGEYIITTTLLYPEDYESKDTLDELGYIMLDGYGYDGFLRRLCGSIRIY